MMLKQMAGLALCIGAFATTATAQTVTGSGTSGTVPVFTGASAVGNSPITVSGGNVTIGTPNYNTQGPTTFNVAGGAFFGGSPWISGDYIAIAAPANGTTSPYYYAEVGMGVTDAANNFLTETWEMGSEGVLSNSDTLSAADFYISNDQLGVISFLIDAANDVGIGGTTMPAGGNLTGAALYVAHGGNVGIGTTSPGATLEVNGNFKMTSNSGAAITFADGTVQSTAYTGVTCGGDFAESVDVTGKRAGYEPGDVLVIDPSAPGKFLKAAEPYSTSVTGIYSTKPGTVGRRQSTPKSPDEVPMAMVGIVPTKVSAENGPIHPGDLLVTSSTLGYAMKGTDHGRMLGAVIGKALGNLDSGTGVIEVVVTLQ